MYNKDNRIDLITDNLIGFKISDISKKEATEPLELIYYSRKEDKRLRIAIAKLGYFDAAITIFELNNERINLDNPESYINGEYSRTLYNLFEKYNINSDYTIEVYIYQYVVEWGSTVEFNYPFNYTIDPLGEYEGKEIIDPNEDLNPRELFRHFVTMRKFDLNKEIEREFYDKVYDGFDFEFLYKEINKLDNENYKKTLMEILYLSRDTKVLGIKSKFSKSLIDVKDKPKYDAYNNEMYYDSVRIPYNIWGYEVEQASIYR